VVVVPGDHQTPMPGGEGMTAMLAVTDRLERDHVLGRIGSEPRRPGGRRPSALSAANVAALLLHVWFIVTLGLAVGLHQNAHITNYTSCC
jgi:predicted secreted protein